MELEPPFTSGQDFNLLIVIDIHSFFVSMLLFSNLKFQRFSVLRAYS